MTKLFVGHARLRWQAPPTPDNPAPTMIRSTCSMLSPQPRKYIHTAALAKNFVPLCLFVAIFRHVVRPPIDFSNCIKFLRDSSDCATGDKGRRGVRCLD